MNKFTIQKSFAISAGAGSGKTYTLSRRYINAILGFDYFREDYSKELSYFDELKASKVNQIVTLTYTEAAALEMKSRIFELISKILDKNLDNIDGDFYSIQEANDALDSKQKEYVFKTLLLAFKDSSNAKISTIHAFCLDIIKTNCDIARIDNKLDIVKEEEKQGLVSKIIFDVLNDIKNEKIIYDINSDIAIYFLSNLINKYINSSKFRADYDSFSKQTLSLFDYQKIISELYPLPYIKEDLTIVKDYILENKIENFQKYIDFLDEYVQGVSSFDAKSWKELSKEYDIKFTFANKPWTQHKNIKKNVDSIKQLEGVVEVYGEIDKIKEELFFDRIDKIKIILHKIKSKYDEELKSLHKIDFDTIISKTSEIMPSVSTNFKYIMIDEFQDTNSQQYHKIIKNAKDEKCNLFVVGDSKQSIYSFQGAEIEVFNNAVKDKNEFSSIEDMSKNHRSDGVVLDTVNKVFKKTFQINKNLKTISSNYEAYAQDLSVNNKNKIGKGSFKYLITSQEYEEPSNELDTITSFIDDVCKNKNPSYAHISKLIANKQKAIAIVFDSSSKIPELKLKLRSKGINARVSKGDNFYHTREINDIFNVLKAIYILSKKKDKITSSERYYLVGAMRSNIIRCDDNSIKEHLDSNTVCKKLLEYVEIFKDNTLAKGVKYIIDSSNVMGVYAHFDDIEQRMANLFKFYGLCLEYEKSNKPNLYKFLDLVQNAIYFSEVKEDEAFYKSDLTKSIEICTIHSTKGLAYPLVLLTSSEKSLERALHREQIKHNNFTFNNDITELVGFKINNYEPLSFRVLKEFNKLKHLAEKRRLLYVALTRAQHDVVISAKIKQLKAGNINISKDSYLGMIVDSLGIDVEELFAQNEKYCIKITQNEDSETAHKKIKYIKHEFKKIEFESKKPITATRIQEKENINAKNDLAEIGTITHKIIELYWNSFDENQDLILDKMLVFEEVKRNKIILHMNNFYKSEVYVLLKNDTRHRFELEFNINNKTGFIDLIYYDKKENAWVIVDFKTGKPSEEKEKKYNEQLSFYKEAMQDLGYKISLCKILWL